jgi:hypothetical protein
MLLPLVLQTAFTTLMSLWMAEAFRAKGPGTDGAEGEKGEAVSGIDSRLKLAAIRRRIAGEAYDAVRADDIRVSRGHVVPLDALMAEEAIRDLERYAGPIVQGFPGVVPGVSKGKTPMYGGSIGAELMFGADDSDILEALSVSGDYDIVGGDGSTEIIGAELIGAAKRGNPQAKAALAKIAMRNAGAVVKRDLANRRRYPLGFVPTEVDAGDAATIPAAPQNLFRPERLVIPSDICFDFGVQDIKVGNQSQFAQSVEVPAAVFSEVSIDTNVTFDTAEVGNQISILVRNKGTEDDLEFTAAAIGTIAKA